MNCSNCGTENEPGRKFCGECGSALVIVCDTCGSPNAPGSKFCGEWQLSVDHFPKLESEGGKLVPWNVRIGHIFCNNEDQGWRQRINAMLKKEKSLEEIAERLNARKVRRPHGTPTWTAASVRKEFIA